MYCCTPNSLYDHVGGLSSTTSSVQHPLGYIIYIMIKIIKALYAHILHKKTRSTDCGMDKNI